MRLGNGADDRTLGLAALRELSFVAELSAVRVKATAEVHRIKGRRHR